jgi:hypothetical protein
MTIALAWVRRRTDTSELLVASDSRLRSLGALDQAQKIFLLERGDCCLGFCGDAQIAYPLFIQVASSLNNHIRTRTRADDITELGDLIGKVLGNLVASWDIDPFDKARELKTTKILLAGWSWKFNKFEIGYFKFVEHAFVLHHRTAYMPHPYLENRKSIVFLGNYESDYREELEKILQRKYGAKQRGGKAKVRIDFDYEPLEALDALLRHRNLPSIGGTAQLVKIYPYGNSLPFVVRNSDGHHYLLGRRLFDWEKTAYPIVSMGDGHNTSIIYPMELIPVPAKIQPDSGEQSRRQQPSR